MLPNILQISGERKEFEQFLVKAQKETQSVLLPFSIGGDTLYQPRRVTNARYGKTIKISLK